MSVSPIVINSVTYDGPIIGSPSPWAPTNIDVDAKKIGVLVEEYDGTRNWMNRGAAKRIWSIHFECDDITRAAVEALPAVGATFSYVDEHGVSYTVQCEADSYSSHTDTVSSDGSIYYTIDLKLFEA
jgi:hypothetical protein